MTNEQGAANRFLSQLRQQASSEGEGEGAQTPPAPQQVIINRPVRCTFVIGDLPADNTRRSGRTRGK